jgi:hypothetical protein
MAQSGHASHVARWPLSGAKRTLGGLKIPQCSAFCPIGATFPDWGHSAGGSFVLVDKAQCQRIVTKSRRSDFIRLFAVLGKRDNFSCRLFTFEIHMDKADNICSL